MNSAFTIISCNADDAMFQAAPGKIHDAEHDSQARIDIDRDHLVKCLVISKAEELIGRMAVYHNTALIYEGKPTAQFGLFECINDPEAAKALLDAGSKIARSLGAAFVIGPMNGSTWNEYRFISDYGKAPGFFTEQAHPLYYPALWEEAGFVAFQEYVSNEAAMRAIDFNSSAFFAGHGLSVRSIEANNIEFQLGAVYEFCTGAFAKSPLFSPITREKFVSKLMMLKQFLPGSMTKIVWNGEGAPVAFILCMRDIFDPEGKTMVVKTIAKDSGCTIPGLMPALYKTILSEGYAAGYRRVIHAFMHVDNTSLRRSHQFEGTIIRNYSLYIRPC